MWYELLHLSQSSRSPPPLQAKQNSSLVSITSSSAAGVGLFDELARPEPQALVLTAASANSVSPPKPR